MTIASCLYQSIRSNERLCSFVVVPQHSASLLSTKKFKPMTSINPKCIPTYQYTLKLPIFVECPSQFSPVFSSRNCSRKVKVMPKKAKEKRSSCRDDDEYVKAAAWAWYQHGAGASSNFIQESDAQNRQKPSSKSSRPSRFKLEAANLNTTSPSLHTVRSRPKSFHGLDRSMVAGFQMFESDEEYSDSSLLDYYEIVELSRRLENSLSFSVTSLHGEESWIERGLSADVIHSPTVIVGDNSHTKKVSKASKNAVVKRWWKPVMCSMTDVVIPGMAEIGSPKRSHHHRWSWKKKSDLKVSERFHGVTQRLQQALVASPWKSPSHRDKDDNIRVSSARRNSLDSSHKRQTCDRGSS